MEYIFIMCSAILITTILVYILANRFLKLHLRWNPLLLCAVCAMIISSVLPHVVVGFAGLAGSLVLLAVFAIVFAYFVARYDARYDTLALGQALEEDAVYLEQGSANVKEKIIMPEQREAAGQSAAQIVQSIIISIKEENAVAAFSEVAATAETSVNSARVTSGETVCEDSIIPAKEKDTADPVTTEIVQAIQTGQDVESDVVTKTAAEDPECVEPSSAEIPEADIVPQAVTQASVRECIHGNNESEQLVETGIEKQFDSLQNADEGFKVEEQEMDMKVIDEDQSLDSLMDYAFQQKEEKNFQQAFMAFRKALHLYAESEVAPFIVVELGNILKNKGAYDEAIQTFFEGRNLPAIQKDSVLEQEFVSTIAYLRIVKNVLLTQRLGFIPYKEIPSEVAEEINTEFAEWRKLA